MPARTTDERQVDSTPARSSLFARLVYAPRAALAWMKSNRLAALVLALASLASVGGLVIVTLMIAAGRQLEPTITLQQCFDALDQGRYDEAISLAETLRQQSQAEELPGGALYVLGVAMARQAGEALLKQRENKYLLAANYLEQARREGFPPDRQAEGLYLLGKALYYRDRKSVV